MGKIERIIVASPDDVIDSSVRQIVFIGGGNEPRVVDFSRIGNRTITDISDAQIGSSLHNPELQRQSLTEALAKITIIAGEVVDEINK